MKLAAVIFDLDGTIIDSEPAWGKAFVNVLGSLGVKVDLAHPEIRGVSQKNNWEKLIQKYNIKTSKMPDELASITSAEFENQISMITLKDGFWDFVDILKENNLPIALATQTRWETTSKIIEHFDLLDIFENVTTSEEVLNPKPDPDIFILAADKLGLEYEDCLVIEDSGAGVTAAREAGMRVVALVDEEKVTPEIEKADKVVESFSDIKFKEIELLF